MRPVCRAFAFTIFESVVQRVFLQPIQHGVQETIGIESEVAANRSEQRVPALRERRAVQQHAVEVDEPALAARPDRRHEVADRRVVFVAVGNARHR